MRRRTGSRSVSAGIIPAFLLLVGACTGITDPVAPMRQSISAKISDNIDLDQQNLLLQYKTPQGTIVDVIPPWGSGAAVYATDNIRFDHATQDGWVVVYNTFDVTQTNSRPALVLYNKYRGLLRWWWYNDQVPAGPSNYLTYALMIDGNNTSALNFVGEFMKDNTVRVTHPFDLKSNSSMFNQGLINQAWYYLDTPFAYDPQIAGQPQASYSLALNGWATSEAKVTLDGDINGTLNGTISGSGGSVNLFGSVINGISSSTIQNSTIVTDNGTKTEASLQDKISSSVSSGLADALKSNLNTLATQGLQIIGSPLSNVFSSILSSNPSPQQKVELKLAAKITLNGNVTTEQPAVVFKGALPGTTRGDPSGYLPYYNETLGAFSLAAPPVVTWKVMSTYPPSTNGQKNIQYFAQRPTVVVNPAIASEVTVSLPEVSLVYIKLYSGKEVFSNYNYLANPNFTGWNPINNVMGNLWFSFSAPYAITYNQWTGTPEQNIVVRVAFTVTPNNGSPPIEVVQMYRPRYVAG